MAVLQAPAPQAPGAVSSTDRDWALYYQLRSQIETPENIGKLILFDLVSGDYEIDDETSFDAVHRLQDRHPGSKLHALRIGYEAVASFDGGLERLPK